MFKLMEQHD